MKIFDTDIIEVVRLLTPPELRKPRISAFLSSVGRTLDTLLTSLKLNRNANLYRLQITPQVCYLEKMLNDRFDNMSRRIFISSPIIKDILYLYTDAENKPVELQTDAEHKPIALYVDTETGIKSADFIVNVPRNLTHDKAEMSALLDIYKLVSKTYTYNYF